MSEQHHQCDILKSRVDNLETRVCIIEAVPCQVDSMDKKIDEFIKNIQTEFNVFKDKVTAANMRFMFWIIGTIFITLVLGLFCQYKSFQAVHESIHKLKIEIIEEHKEVKDVHGNN